MKNLLTVEELIAHMEHKGMPSLCIDEIVSSPVAKKKRYDELKDFFEGRMVQNKDWFANNNTITSSYRFVKSILDNIAGR